MRFLEWNNTSFLQCNILAVLTSKELEAVNILFPKDNLQSATLDDEAFYLFIDTKAKRMAPMSKLSYAFGGGYNGYPPYGDELIGLKIDFSEYTVVNDSYFIELAHKVGCETNKKGNVLDKNKLFVFAKKWQRIFYNTSWNGQIIESVIFPEEAWEVGLDMDCCKSFSEGYPDINLDSKDNENFQRGLDSVYDVQTLGNLIFSEWRWWNHWAMSRPSKEDFQCFFIAFDRLIKLLEKEISRPGINIIGFHLPDEEYGCLSNWYLADFEYAGVKFSSVEQFMMYHKVLMAKNYSLAEKIMSTNDPSKIKELASAKCFHDFNEIRDAWTKYSYTIVKRGCRAKFIQNPKLMAKLLLTDKALLVECSRTDKLWGNGISINDPSWHDVSAWKGDNKMGRILMELRSEFLAAQLSGKEFRYKNVIDSDDIPEWLKTPAELSRYPEYHNAVYAYVSTLSKAERSVFLNNNTSFAEWDEVMHTNMGGGLRIIGFYEMKQEIFDIAERLRM